MNSKQKTLSVTPLIILTGLAFYTILTILTTKFELQGELYDRTFNLSHYLGFASIAISWILFVTRINIYILTLTGILILGTFSLVNFLPSNYTWGGSLGFGNDLSIGIGFQPLSFVLLILSMIINSSTHSEFYNKFLKSETKEKTDKPEFRNSMVDTFKRKYADKSQSELTEIVNGGGQFQEAATLAASELLNEKYGK